MKRIYDSIDAMTEMVVDIQSELVSRPALSPENNGTGEREKADWIIDYMRDMGITDIHEYKAPDDRVPCGHRPNITAVIPGQDTSRTFWVIAHMDVVPVGERTLWDSDPWTLRREGDTIYGRGVEDNHQGLVSALLTAKALLADDTTPVMNFGILLVSDEETGNKYGLQHIADKHLDIFGENDLILVPDSGDPDSTQAEVAEKGMFWLKVTVNGKQCHASTPDEGQNAMVAASAMVLKVKQLEKDFDARDELFSPPYSTFEPTKREANVENVNTLPGRDVFYVDSRVLPQYNIQDILDRIREYGSEVEEEYGCSIDYDVLMREEAAPATPTDAEIVQRIGKGVREICGKEIRPVGIGGGTVAAILRRKGKQALVWSTLNHFAHQPNEASSIKSTVNDAKVMAHALLTE